MSGVTFAGWEIHLQVKIRVDPMGYDQPAAIYDDPDVTYGGFEDADAQWLDVDCEVTRVTCTLGGREEQIPGVRAALGRLTASLYDPKRILDPAASPFAILTTPGAPVRLVAVDPELGPFNLWTGTVDSWDHNLLNSTGTLNASDNVAILAGIQVTDYARPAETSMKRMEEVLATFAPGMVLSWVGEPVNLSTAKFSGDLWTSVLVTTAEAEQSVLWMDGFGHPARMQIPDVPATTAATDCDDGVSPIIFTRLSSTYDDDTVANHVSVERLNIGSNERNPIVRQDPESVRKHGPHSLQETTLPLLDDAALIAWADRVLDLRGNPVPAPTGMGVEMSNNLRWLNRTVPAMVYLRVGDVLDITVTSRPPLTRWLAGVAEITHTITPTVWDVQIGLVGGPRFAENAGYDDPTSVYDVSVYARKPGVAPLMEVPA